MLKNFLYWLVRQVAWIHEKISAWNDQVEHTFSDKELHFLVIGALGMLLIFLIYPLFKQLAKENHVMIIAWIYVFTLILVLTFAIEIGQSITHSGDMEFGDIVFGIAGFVIMFAVFAIARAAVNGIIRHVRRKRVSERSGRHERMT